MVDDNTVASKKISTRKRHSKGRFKKEPTVTTEKTAEQPYELFDDVINKISDHIFILTNKGRISYANKQLIDTLGASSAQIQDAPIARFFSALSGAIDWQKSIFLPAKQSKSEQTFVWKLKKSSKSNVVLYIKGIFFIYQGEEFLFCTAREAGSAGTQEKINNSRKDSSNFDYQAICDSAVETIFVLNNKGIVEYVNSSIKELIGRETSDCIGKHFKEFLHESSSKSTAGIFKGALKGNSTLTEELMLVDEKGEPVLVEFTSAPVYQNKEVVQVQFVLRNLGARKNSQDASDEEEKMQAVQSFIKGTVQEIQKPLEGVLTHTESIIAKYKEKDFEYIGHREFSELLKGLEAVCDQIRYCSTTTERLVDINQEKAGLNKNSSDSNESVKEALRMVKTHLDLSEIEVKQLLGRNLPPVAVGETELIQILSNVFTNAIQSIRGKGLVRVKTRFNETEDRIYFEFSDNGVGMSKETLARVFEPFFTTKQRGLEKSSGLGLSTVYATVKKIDGDIKIQSSLRRGTRVQIFLPVFKGK